MIIFTSICANYLHKARTLADSVKKHMPDAHFVVCLVERKIKDNFLYPSFDEIILAKDAWGGNFDRFIYKHAIVEASTAVKGQFFRHLYEKYPQEKELIYLDPDTFVYDDFVELKALLKDHPIILCPHLLQPGNIDMELSSTAHGVYNLGFLAVNNSDEAKKFINWWADRLGMFCYDDIPRGIFTDQKWVDLAPCFFDVYICKHHGYDFATWSLLDCGMTVDKDVYKVHGDPLRFIHFSGYGRTAEKCMTDWLPEGKHPFRDLYAAYSKLHDSNNNDHISQTTWSYAVYESGEPIKDSLRLEYRKNYDLMFSIVNPFALSNKEMARLLKGKVNVHSLRTYWEKALFVLKNDGFKALVKKCWQKLFR